MNRLSIVFVALWVPLLSAAGQNPMAEMAPIRILADIDAALDHDALAFSVGMDGVTPLEYFLPNVSPGSRLEVLGLGVGARLVDGNATFRWRIVPMVIDVAKPPWNGGVTVLRYDRTGIRTLEADWLATHGGPSALFSIGGMTIGPSLLLRAALASRRTGRSFFPDLNPDADDGATGAATSAAGRLVFSVASGFTLTAIASIERLWAGPDPELRVLEAILRVPLASRWTLVGRGALQEARVGDATDRVTVLGFGIRFSPRSANSV